MAVVTEEQVRERWRGGVLERVEELGMVLRRQAGALAAAEYRWLLALEEFDRLGGWAEQGARSCGQWLSWACGLSPEAGRERVRVARALPGLRLVCEAFADGRLSYSKVRAITRVATPANEELLVTYGLHGTAAQLETAVRDLRREQAAAEASAAQQAFEGRWLRWRTDEDGMVRLSGRFPADAVAGLVALVEAVADTMGEDEPPPQAPAGGCSADEQAALVAAGAAELPVVSPQWAVAPPREVRRADALVRIADTVAAQGLAPAHERHRVVVHVRAGTLVDEPAEPAEAARSARTEHAAAGRPVDTGAVEAAGAEETTGAQATRVSAVPPPPASWPDTDDDRSWIQAGATYLGGSIAAATARMLACDAELVTVLEDSHGNPVALSDADRRPPRWMRRALAVRDGGCRFPTCTARRWVDAHHVVWASNGGPTVLDNLVLLCRFHHRLVHHAGFQVRRAGPQRFSFHRPDGVLIRDVAPPIPGDALSPAAANVAEGTSVTADTAVPDWDGTPMDRDLAFAALWGATYPGGWHPANEPAPSSAEEPDPSD